MDILLQFLDILLHLDKHLAILVEQYGPWIYAILFFVIFAETGFVVTPFLPGDSLLFVAGALAALGGMDIVLLMATLTTAAVLGNQVNYHIGRFLGPKVFHWEDSRFFNRKALEKTHAFYEKHGGKAIIIARFMPLVRTFVPVVAGAAKMPYSRFATFNIAGGVAWVSSMTVTGYVLGQLVPNIGKHVEKVIIVVVFLSILPGIISYLRRGKTPATPAAPPAPETTSTP
jgi:membrane-associated protein